MKKFLCISVYEIVATGELIYLEHALEDGLSKDDEIELGLKLKGFKGRTIKE